MGNVISDVRERLPEKEEIHNCCETTSDAVADHTFRCWNGTKVGCQMLYSKTCSIMPGKRTKQLTKAKRISFG